VIWSLWPRSLYSPDSARTSQMTKSVSLEPEASLSPRASNVRAVTALLWPVKTAVGVELVMSHSLIEPSL
jgi:hypothetical protein